MSPTVDSNLVMSLLNIFESMLIRGLAKYRNAETSKDEEVTDARQLKQRIQDIECCFFFALIWSIGKSGTSASQVKFSSFLVSYISNVNCIEIEYGGVWNALQVRLWSKPDFHSSVKGTFTLNMPMKNDYYECVYIPEESKWKFWTELLPTFIIPSEIPYSSIVVPNSYTAQFSYMIELLIPNRKNVLMCGSTGTGKSVYINNIITGSLPQDKYKALCLGFSAKTSANMTQDIIDGKLDKRRKGVYGPPMGQQTIIFVDDMNMPEVEVYGAQPPIELIRQLADSGGWYDIKEKSWRTIVDTSLIAAMGPPGGGRNHITPRLLRHFNLFCFAEFDNNTLKRIFSTIVQWHFQGQPFPAEVRGLSESIVDATLDTYRAAMATLLPTPQKSHYTFNLRDFSRIIQGVLLCKPSEGFGRSSLVRLWCHESLRVLGDRLVDDTDRLWFHQHLDLTCVSRFGANFIDIYAHLATGPKNTVGKKTVSPSDLRNCIFGDYMTDDIARPYKEIQVINIYVYIYKYFVFICVPVISIYLHMSVYI